MIVIILLAVFFLFVACYMVYNAYHDNINNIEVNIGLRAPLKVFFISDIHRRKINQDTIAEIPNNLDLVVIGGDLLEKGVSFNKVRHNLQLLKKFHTPIYFIWGNNDYEVDSNALEQMFIDLDINVLKNKAVNLNHHGSSISLVGLDCCNEGLPDYEKALSEATGSYSILLTHDPFAFYELNEEQTKSIDFVLSGHTHGGQIRIFGFGPYTRGGLKQHNSVPILVSEGYGYTKFPFRLGTKAECHVITVT